MSDRIDLNDLGELDDVALRATGFRLEQMDHGHWWLRVDRPDGLPSLVVNLTTARQGVTRIRATWWEES